MKKIYDKYKIDESNKTCMDYEFYLRICASENILFVKSENIATINIFDGNISSDISGKQIQEARIVAKRYADKISYSGKLFGTTKVDISQKSTLFQRLKDIVKK
ncbi:hypothetical protein [Chryseobacterium oryzae]|uniref:Uncharacterized protein n=1 Tax=Chryseobacterium oryzae TaxID=2929799 RepID=A0ABY4BFR9_9FLAO|nr:hypothetical protein [Chryseobacterium oryzae]UOE37999.1 hypothetical protein MTP08_13245 [Chryseobacterium oryzae]